MSIAAALLEAAPNRVPPLVRPAHGDTQVIQLLAGYTAGDLFPGARSPQGALAGLYLYFGCWQQAHEAAQDDESPEGCYWHGIIHRQEPDRTNANYWFRRVGRRPVQAALAERFGSWDHSKFIALCESARRGSAEEQQALQQQLAEWRLLYDYCKEPA